MRMLVLGAGLQGSACAYDLLQNPEVTEVRLADLKPDPLAPFLKPLSGPRLIPTPLDVRDQNAVRALMRESDAVMSAIPYYLNLDLARLAVEVGTNFTDLGGNTEIVLEQKKLEAQAREKGVSVVPDTGVAPGMVNILSQMGIDRLDETSAVRIYVGGLPQHPEGPLKYQVVYSLEGVLDYYTTLSWVLRDSKLTHVTALSELETIPFDAPVGDLEAFHTAGGLSLMAQRYAGKVATMEYKTLRYPGHAQIMEAIRELGLLELTPLDVKGQHVVPRDVAVAAMGPRLRKANSPDLVALRVVVEGTKDGKPKRHQWDLVDHADEAKGISAMMRTTGFTLSITGQMQAGGDVAPGVHTPDECIPGEKYVAELAKRGIQVKHSES